MDELWERFSSGEMLSADSLKVHNNGKRFTTSCKDTLYAGDGITPNVFVPIDTSSDQQKIFRMLSEGKFSSHVYNYYLLHKQQMDQYATATDYASRFNSADMLNIIINSAPDSLRLKNISIKEKELLQQRLKALLARYKWRNAGFYEVLNNEDAVIKKALQQFAK